MRILMWGEIKSGGPYDVFRRLNYSNIYQELCDNYHANMINVGNKVWIQGIISCLSTSDNELFFYNSSETWDEINNKYDKIVYSAANLFSKSYIDVIKSVSDIFKNSKIPVYVIAVGAQAKSYDYLDNLSNEIGDETKDFLETIYKTGGEIACRGSFTKAFFDKVENNTAVVTGCPSLFQNGRNLKIYKTNSEKIKPIFNGNLLSQDQLFDEYPNAVFIDQDSWIQESYNTSFYKQKTIKCLVDLYKKHGYKKMEVFLNGRIKLFYDIPDWKRFIEKEQFNFSIGTRIHGNIMSLLCGIPSVVLACDSRTMEMAQYYDIPFEQYSNKPLDVEKIFSQCDFTKFNESFAEKFDFFEKFLKDCGLVKKINQENIFWGKNIPEYAQEIEIKKTKIKNIFYNFNLLGNVPLRFFSKFDIGNNQLLNSNVPKESYGKEK